MSYPTKNQNISLHSRLRNSLKNRLIEKFEILIISIDLKVFFVKSLQTAGLYKRVPLLTIFNIFEDIMI